MHFIMYLSMFCVNFCICLRATLTVDCLCLQTQHSVDPAHIINLDSQVTYSSCDYTACTMFSLNVIFSRGDYFVCVYSKRNTFVSQHLIVCLCHYSRSKDPESLDGFRDTAIRYVFCFLMKNSMRHMIQFICTNC